MLPPLSFRLELLPPRGNLPGMPSRLPVAVSFFRLSDRLLSATQRLLNLLRDEILWGCIPLTKKYDSNMAVHSRESTYLPGGHWFEAGLFDWERKALTMPPFPGRGHLLLGAAGGGRELKALSELGYAIDAFEPAESLFEGARGVASSFPSARVARATYRDLVRAVEHKKNLFGNEPVPSYDAIVLGWGSLSSVLSHTERRCLLESLRLLGPRAPVLISFLAQDLHPPPSRIEMLRPPLRRLLKALGCSELAEPGDRFLQGSGFVHLFTPDEIKALAAATGYSLYRADLAPYPHAILMPR